MCKIISIVYQDSIVIPKLKKCYFNMEVHRSSIEFISCKLSQLNALKLQRIDNLSSDFFSSSVLFDLIVRTQTNVNR